MERLAGRFGTTIAVVLALVAQTLLSNKAFGVALGIVPGVALYVVAAVIYLMSRRERERSDAAATRERERSGAATTSGDESGVAGHTPAWEWGLIILILLGGLYLMWPARLYQVKRFNARIWVWPKM